MLPLSPLRTCVDRPAPNHNQLIFLKLGKKQGEKEERKEAEKKRKKQWLTNVTLKDVESIRTISERAKWHGLLVRLSPKLWLKLVGLTDFGLADGQTTLCIFFCVDRTLVLNSWRCEFWWSRQSKDWQTKNINLHVISISISIEFWNAFKSNPRWNWAPPTISTNGWVLVWVGLGCIHLYFYRMVLNFPIKTNTWNVKTSGIFFQERTVFANKMKCLNQKHTVNTAFYSRIKTTSFYKGHMHALAGKYALQSSYQLKLKNWEIAYKQHVTMWTCWKLRRSFLLFFWLSPGTNQMFRAFLQTCKSPEMTIPSIDDFGWHIILRCSDVAPSFWRSMLIWFGPQVNDRSCETASWPPSHIFPLPFLCDDEMSNPKGSRKTKLFETIPSSATAFPNRQPPGFQIANRNRVSMVMDGLLAFKANMWAPSLSIQ